MMMLAVMYGMMPEREDAEAAEGAAGEQVEEAEGALRLDALLELLDGVAVDAGHPDGVAESVEQRSSPAGTGSCSADRGP